jgi:hypothetical protein
MYCKVSLFASAARQNVHELYRQSDVAADGVEAVEGFLEDWPERRGRNSPDRRSASMRMAWMVSILGVPFSKQKQEKTTTTTTLASKACENHAVHK